VSPRLRLLVQSFIEACALRKRFLQAQAFLAAKFFSARAWLDLLPIQP